MDFNGLNRCFFQTRNSPTTDPQQTHNRPVTDL